MKSDFRAMDRRALGLAVLAAGLTIVFRLLPEDIRGWWNFTPIGGLFLFCGARLRGWLKFALPFAVLLGTDLGFWFFRSWPLSPSVYLALGLYILLGEFLRDTRNAFRVGGFALLASVLFFLITNTESWIMQAMPYPMTPAGLLQCYEMGLPFWRGTLIGDLIFSSAFFAAFALLPVTVQTEEILPERIGETR